MNWLLIFLAAAIVGYLIFIWLIKKYGRKWSARDIVFFQKTWCQILENGDAVHQLMDADKLLDQMMKRRGYAGSMGDKLKKHGGQFSDLDGLWRAHKLRNRLAHEIGAKISRQESEKALKSFKKAFQDLGLPLI